MPPLRSSTFPFLKVSATGNDFLLVDLLGKPDHWNKEWGQTPRAEVVRMMCHRHEGLGADGMVFLEPDNEFDFVWDFYNSDGGTAEMCGNAARAVSLYFQQTYSKSSISFRSIVGPVHSNVESPDKITVQLPKVLEVALGQISTSGLSYNFVRAGVPHAVVQIESDSAISLLREADRMRLRGKVVELKQEKAFLADGVNVTFFQDTNLGQIESVTFERGVENFTYACGTGAIAAAYVLTQGTAEKPTTVQVPGGTLQVHWQGGHPFLTGPAKVVAQMHWIGGQISRKQQVKE